MSSGKVHSQDLPDGWVVCQSKSTPGRTYYFNRKTGKSSWSQPQIDEIVQSKTSITDKSNKVEKRKKEELVKKCSKRKSDRLDETAIDVYNKRKKNETKDAKDVNHTKDCKKKHGSPKKQTPSKSTPNSSFNISSNQGFSPSPLKSPQVKNLANARLSMLREQLASEVAEEMDAASVASNKKTKNSPPTAPFDTPIKSKTELKTPTADSKSNQSPSNDSVHSIPSPSQFLAANKIISSMKAHLPDEYYCIDKQKDTFAYIENGICNEMPEYSALKHPPTPPQFSEASKLMSAIKSRLTYKDEAKAFAQKRLEKLRTNLSGEISDTDLNMSKKHNKSVSNFTVEAMETEDIKEEKQSVSTEKKGNTVTGGDLVLVVDTNIFIHELDLIKNILNSYIKGYSAQPTLIIPWRVINELDCLKDNNNGQGALCKRAKTAMDYLYKALPENSRLVGQPLRDSNSHIYPCEIPDDEILNCALQQVERGKNVMLLSNDKNLCNKATINNVRHISVSDLRRILENRAQAAGPDPELGAVVSHCQQTVYKLLANILENEMRAQYNILWQHVVYKAPPWTLSDVLQCLLKHWIAVFNEVFPRIEHLMRDLKNSLMAIENKDSNTLTHSEVAYFKELCLDVSRRCQIIPEYMELAKRTVEVLQRGRSEPECPQQTLVRSFEALWTVLSSYCAKLCNGLGRPHGLEDKIPGDEPVTVLTGKWAHISGHLHDLTLAIKHVISVENPPEEHLQRLEGAFNRALATLCTDEPASAAHIRLFVINSRMLLEEAYTKFTQLIDLLNACKNSFSDVN